MAQQGCVFCARLKKTLHSQFAKAAQIFLKLYRSRDGVQRLRPVASDQAISLSMWIIMLF